MKKILCFAILAIFTLLSCNKKQISKIKKTTENIQQKAGGIEIGTPCVVPFSVPYIFASNIPTTQQITCFSLNIGDVNNNNIYDVYFTDQLDGGYPNFEASTAVNIANIKLINGQATVVLTNPWDFSTIATPTDNFNNYIIFVALLDPTDVNQAIEGYITISKFTEFTVSTELTGYSVNPTNPTIFIPSIASNVPISIDLLPNRNLLSSQVATGDVWRLMANIVITKPTGTEIFSPQGATLAAMQNITLNNVETSPSPIRINFLLGNSKNIKKIVFNMYWVYIGLAALSPTMNKTITIGSVTFTPPRTCADVLADFQIKSGADLQCLNGLSEGVFILSNDIDLSTYSDWLPITNFTATLDGAGFNIDELRINGASLNLGLFNTLGLGATVRNLNIIAPSISNTNTNGCAGGLAGTVHGATIQNVSVQGGVITAQFAGSFVGFMTAGTINDSHATGVVNGLNPSSSGGTGGFIGAISGGNVSSSHATGTVNGFNNAGGFVGTINTGITTINKCYATGTVSGTAHAGGFVGSMIAGTISNAYATGTTTSSVAGGFAGLTNGGTISRSYATGAVTGPTTGRFLGRKNNGTFQNCYTGNTPLVGNNVSIIGIELLNITNATAASFVNWQFGAGKPWVTFVAGQWPVLSL